MTDCHYAVLEVECNATTSQIRASYKRLVLHRHPDKGGCAEAFKALSEAYTVLTDPEERAAYDASGHSAVQDLRDANASRESETEQPSIHRYH
jgi:DnaJ-class molecular chaperone